jgi:hypothetical protein
MVLSLHECVDPAAVAESGTEPLHSIANSAATEFTVDSVAAESVAEPLRSVADSAATGAAPTETS